MLKLALVFIAVVVQLGYEITTTPPRDGMLPVGTIITARIGDSAGSWNDTPVTITGYVIWHVPPREAEYYVTWQGGYWSIWPQATVDQYPRNTLKAASVSAALTTANEIPTAAENRKLREAEFNRGKHLPSDKCFYHGLRNRLRKAPKTTD